MSSSPVPQKTRHVAERCTLNLSRAQTTSRCCGMVVRRDGCQLKCRPRHLIVVQNYEVSRQQPFRPLHLTMVQNDEVRHQKSSES
ncbi:hypothetical protein TNCV_957711 [Trichonephila clavipes]|nr:hypothetical protein TNCV_957711 [Trichonephila clavipes]